MWLEDTLSHTFKNIGFSFLLWFYGFTVTFTERKHIFFSSIALFFCVFWLQCSSDSFQTFLREQSHSTGKIMLFTVKTSFREKNVTLESTKLNPCEIRFFFFFTITTALCFITLETPTLNTFDFNHDQLPTLSKFHQG